MALCEIPIPEGYEFVRYGLPIKDELWLDSQNDTIRDFEIDEKRIVVRKIKKWEPYKLVGKKVKNKLSLVTALVMWSDGTVVSVLNNIWTEKQFKANWELCDES